MDEWQHMFHKIMMYIDHIVELVKPKQLLYLAVDGVAPRAKMNQQRERRFRSAQVKAVELKESSDSSAADVRHYFDSNCITPGTTFMLHLSEYLQYYVAKRVAAN
uniref:5'-3' exoribonuclease 1 n=1 Tax=Lygus hesperus TaxID=30085 RepID=A0A0A9YG36_LYGHE